MTKLKLNDYKSLVCKFKHEENTVMSLIDEIIYIPIMAYAKYETDFCAAWGVNKPPLSWEKFTELFEESLISESSKELTLLIKN